MNVHTLAFPPFLADERWVQAILLFNCHDWYAAHDAFEELWHESEGINRKLLQGIIQVAVAEHHLINGNRRGALLLMAEGLNHLQASLSCDVALDLHSLQAVVAQRLAALQSDQSLDSLPVPVLLRLETNQV